MPPITVAHPRPVDDLEGVGPTRAKHLKALGVHHLRDLLEYFPRTYQFESSELPISRLVPEQIQTVRGTVVAVNFITGRGKARFEATIDDGSEKLALVWFNASYVRRHIHPGKLIRVQGRVKLRGNMPQMINPKWHEVSDDTAVIEEERFRPIYPASASLSSDNIGKIVEANLEEALAGVEEWFEPELLDKRKIIGRREAYRLIHRPANMGEAQKARRRLVYDELMLMQLGLGISKRLRDGRLTAPILRVDKLLDERIRCRFPFAMTGAQEQATYEILKDFRGGRPMNRLLQGDVGSGKTVVALYAMLVAVANKMQSALLAPTEVLAEQHFLTLKNFLRDSSVAIELYTSRTKRQSRAKIQKALADGKVHLAVGTQALIQEDVDFANLGLVVVDEQHKLGVRQRATLTSKGHTPHYLVMTATPIPRTLALSYFADFDVSVIDELPPSRQPIQTRWFKPKDAPKAYEILRKEVGAGRQAYVVVPQVEGDGLEDVKSVANELKRLSECPLHGLRLAPLHGQMSAEDKQQSMSLFRSREIDVLVATTVIEVGIDVPNATIMLIDNAERFGLSQLHQLRGRVGRGEHLSHCLLLGDAPTESADARLKAMTRTTDGFEIAELDLQLRGPGQFFGTRQHGLPELRMADLTQELALLHLAREDALGILQRDPKLAAPEHHSLRAALQEQFGDALALAQVG
ncbi:MAG TPA: ATP-dependent DNA helicase RecG [Tepidisphaeraceae bacterium]|nr:ATP-dependent DNA helicase RecG [Tepidisphaeraceae bacterium]